MSRFYRYEVKADSAAEFFAVQRETAEIYKANKAPHPRYAWTSLTGDSMFFFMMVPSAGVATLMDDTWLQKQGTEMQRSGRISRLRKASSSLRVQIISIPEEATWDPTPDGAPDAFAVVSIYSVKPGRVQEFLALMKEGSAVVQKIGKAKSSYVNRVNYGGDAYEFIVATGYSALADITGQGEFRAATGDAYTAYFKKMGEAVNSVQREIARYRPEFSYLPAK